VLLALALVHGMNGVRVVADDYIHSRGWRLVTATTLWTITFIFMVIGAQIILSFQPSVGTG
jgi:succinate dehydrogenase / fumarate reductase membrane anchor subunit